MKTVAIPAWVNKPLDKIGNDDAIAFVEAFKKWLYAKQENISLSQFSRDVGLPRPYAFRDYLVMNFTGTNNTVDFNSLWNEAEHIREDKLVQLGLFNKKINANFLLGLMKSRFGWHENVVVAGISMDAIMEAKEKAVKSLKAVSGNK